MHRGACPGPQRAPERRQACDRRRPDRRFSWLMARGRERAQSVLNFASNRPSMRASSRDTVATSDWSRPKLDSRPFSSFFDALVSTVRTTSSSSGFGSRNAGAPAQRLACAKHHPAIPPPRKNSTFPVSTTSTTASDVRRSMTTCWERSPGGRAGADRPAHGCGDGALG